MSGSDSTKRTYELQCQQRNHLDVRSDNKTKYHLAICDLGGDKPDLVLHQGPNTKAPRLAASKVLRSKKELRIHLGVEETPAKDDWSVVRCISTGSADEFRFTATIKGGIEKSFYWTKTREKELGASPWTGRDFKLMDDGSGEVFAVYLDRMGIHAIGQRGRVEWMRVCGQDVEVKALIVLFSILERKSRAVRAVFSALSGGGGKAGVMAA